MLFFVDSCDVGQIAELNEMGLVDGVTTNPTLVMKSGRDFISVIREICQVVHTSVSAEVIAADFEGMLQEADELLKIGDQITIKLPVTKEGLKACYYLSQQGVSVNMTLCFTPQQALMCAKAGAEYVSPFVGRLDDIGQDGLVLIDDICAIFSNYPDLATKVLVASVRSPLHVVASAKLGADVVTMPVSLFHTLLHHPLTDKGLAQFNKDWAHHQSNIV